MYNLETLFYPSPINSPDPGALLCCASWDNFVSIAAEHKKKVFIAMRRTYPRHCIKNLFTSCVYFLKYLHEKYLATWVYLS